VANDDVFDRPRCNVPFEGLDRAAELCRGLCCGQQSIRWARGALAVAALGLGLWWEILCALAQTVVTLIPIVERGVAVGFNPSAQTGYSGPLTGERLNHAMVGLGHVCALQ
jgi:hypothetical protein